MMQTNGMVMMIFILVGKCDLQRKKIKSEKKAVEDIVCPLGKLYPVSTTKGLMVGRGLFIITLITLFKAASPNMASVINDLSNLSFRKK